MKEKFAEKAMAIIRHAVNSQYAGNVLEASRAWGVNNNNLSEIDF